MDLQIVTDLSVQPSIQINDHSPDFMTELAIMRQMKKFGYDPTVNCPTTFPALFDDLCNNCQFRRWIGELVPEEIGGGENPKFDAEQRAKMHLWIGERTPVWTKRWNILLSIIASGMWNEWLNYCVEK